MAVFRFRNSWKAEVWIDGRKVRTKCFARKVDADNWVHRTKFAPQENASGSQSNRETFDDLARRFREHHFQSIRPETAKRYNIDLQRRIEPHFRYRKLSSITSEMIDEFKSKIQAEMRSPKSVNNCLHTLRLMLNKAVRWNMLAKSPYNVDSIKIPRNYNYQWWDDKDYIQEFLYEAKFRTKYWPAYVIALETGMRLGEITGLSIEDIDFENGRIRVWRQWYERLKALGPCKHDIERYIDFGPTGNLGRALREAIKNRDSGPVLITENSGRVLNHHIAVRHFKRVIRHAGVPDINFHALRHTFASWYMKEIGDIWELKRILGHTNIVTTQRYAHHSAKHRSQPLGLTDGVEMKPLTLLKGRG